VEEVFVCLFVCLCCFIEFFSAIRNSYDKDCKKSFLAFDIQLFDVSRQMMMTVADFALLDI